MRYDIDLVCKKCGGTTFTLAGSKVAKGLPKGINMDTVDPYYDDGHLPNYYQAALLTLMSGKSHAL